MSFWGLPLSCGCDITFGCSFHLPNMRFEFKSSYYSNNFHRKTENCLGKVIRGNLESTRCSVCSVAEYNWWGQSTEKVLLPCRITQQIFALAPLYFTQHKWWSANLLAIWDKQLRSGASAHPGHLWLLLCRCKQVTIIIIIINIIILDLKQRWTM